MHRRVCEGEECEPKTHRIDFEKLWRQTLLCLSYAVGVGNTVVLGLEKVFDKAGVDVGAHQLHDGVNEFRCVLEDSIGGGRGVHIVEAGEEPGDEFSGRVRRKEELGEVLARPAWLWRGGTRYVGELYNFYYHYKVQYLVDSRPRRSRLIYYR